MLGYVDEVMPIGEFSERSGLSAKRLRSYAAGGLLVPVAVDSATGYRYYSPGQLRDAHLIDALREAGVPLADIASLLRDPSAAHLDAWATRVEMDAAHRHEALDLARRLLDVDAASFRSAQDEKTRKGSSMTMLQTASRVDVGRVRDNNEDVVASGDQLVAVADGMGGGPGGEIAAEIAIALVQAAFTGRSLDELSAGVRAANRAIWERASGSAELEGMGSTICALGVIDDGSVAVVNVGDSRAYVWRDGALSQLTQDHTVTADMVRRGELSAQEAVEHPHRNVLTRVLGVGPDVDPDGAVYTIAEGDRVLLCTDGLFNEVPDDEIAAVMTNNLAIQSTADALVQAALAAGARDNVAVVIAEVGSQRD